MRISDWSSDVCSSDLTDDTPADASAPVAVQVDFRLNSDSGYVFASLSIPEQEPMPSEEFKTTTLTLTSAQFRTLTIGAIKTALTWPSLRAAAVVEGAYASDAPLMNRVAPPPAARSEERRVGTEGVSTLSCRWWGDR